jgi:hypothetical protein
MLEHRYTLSGISGAVLDGPAELAEAAPAPQDQELRDSDSMQAALATTGSAPEIVDFDAYIDMLDILVISGKVVDTDPVGLPVSLDWWDGGWHEMETDSMGQFFHTAEIGPGSEGWVFGVSWNDYGESETREAFVENGN